MHFHAQESAVANLLVEQTKIVQRERRRFTVPQFHYARIPFLISAKIGLLYQRQRGKQVRKTLDPVLGSKPIHHHDFPEARVPALLGTLRMHMLPTGKSKPQPSGSASRSPRFPTCRDNSFHHHFRATSTASRNAHSTSLSDEEV